MANLRCLGCTTLYAVGAPRCPHCGSTKHMEEGAPMPKITRHSGASNAAAPAKDGEQSSPGSSSETSTEKAPSTPEQSETSRRSPARTTGSRSKKGRLESGTADSTDTSGPATDAADGE